MDWGQRSDISGKYYRNHLYSTLVALATGCRGGGLSGTVMFVDIGALLNPVLTFEDPIPSTHWPPSHNPVWFCTIIRVSVVY